jgi:putative phosphoesterase
MDAAPLTRLADGCRIGVLADTHCDRGSRRLPAAVFEAFAGVQLILHLGDCGDASALDELARLAPVLATRGGDDSAADGRYAAMRVIAAGALTVGALFDVSTAGLLVHEARPAAASAADVDARLTGAFGRRGDVVLFAATHASLVAHLGGVLFVNPGSATLPAAPTAASVAVLDVRAAVASVDIVRV